MEKIPVERIKRQVIVPFAVALLAVLAVGIGSMIYVEHHSRRVRFANELAQVQYFFDELQAVEARHLGNELTLISRDVSLRDAFLRQDRDTLLRLASPIFESLKAASGVTHFYFFTPDQRVFLRVHHPLLHGDLHHLVTVRQAAQTGQAAHGMELGAFGHLSLRVVQPLVVNGEMVGLVGLGKEMHGFAAQLRQLLGAEVFIALKKQHLERRRWEEGLQILGRQGDWDELPGAVVIDRTVSTLPQEVRGLFAMPTVSKAMTIELPVAGRYYSIGLSPLHDGSGTNLGTILVMFDVTAERQSLLMTMGLLALTGLCLAGGGFLFFWGHIDRLDRRLVALQEKLNKAVVEKGDQLRHSTDLLQADIAMRQEVERDLNRACHRNALILECAGQGIFGLDAEGRHTFVNPAAAAMLGYTPEEMVGQKSHSLCHHTRQNGTVYPEAECPIYMAFKDGQSHHVERDVFWRKDGTMLLVEYTSTPIREEGRLVGAVVAFRDISERLAAEKERESLQAQIRQAQKMEAIGTLAGGIAHDFNNILAAIIGYTELALLDAREAGPTAGYLAEIRRASDRAKQLVGQILTFSRQSEMQRQPMYVQPIIKEALKLLRASLPAEIEIRQQIAPETGKVMADPVQIHQCFMNLCVNAGQAMREKGGVLEVTVAEEELHAGAIPRGSDLAPGKYLRLTVRDTGHGMEQGIIGRIFDPFFSTRERGESTGLGLAVVHGIVKGHGGGIVVESKVGEGTTFTLYFPVRETVAETSATGVAVGSLPTGKGERVLLVDDEAGLAEMGQRILDYLGYVVTPMTSSTEALARFAAKPDAFDLVLTDQSMPGMNGLDMARQMLTLRPELPVVLCTGFSETVSPEQAKAAGIRGYVMKPLTINELAAVCRQALNSR